MFELFVDNLKGGLLELTGNPAYAISEIDGLEPPEATINAVHTAGMDGSTYNSAYVNDRTITITLAINGPAEENRIALYKYFRPKHPVRLRYKNGMRDVFIDGYVQSVQIQYFAIKQIAQIIVYCPQPFFNGTTEEVQSFSSVEDMFEFPFDIEASGIEFSVVVPYTEKSVINGGDVNTGAQIRITAYGSVTNPTIWDVTNHLYMKLALTLQPGEAIVIDTRRGQKQVTKITDGVETNVIGKLAAGSTWFELSPGDNVYTYTTESPSDWLDLTFTVVDQYGGV